MAQREPLPLGEKTSFFPAVPSASYKQSQRYPGDSHGYNGRPIRLGSLAALGSATDPLPEFD
jgi:hypothetical protein